MRGSAQLCYRKGTVSTISKPYPGITGGFVAQPKCRNTILVRELRRLEYASSNQGGRGSNPFGRTFYQRSSAALATRSEEQIEPLSDNKTEAIRVRPAWRTHLEVKDLYIPGRGNVSKAATASP
jgi:hypothetical protein